MALIYYSTGLVSGGIVARHNPPEILKRISQINTPDEGWHSPSWAGG